MLALGLAKGATRQRGGMVIKCPEPNHRDSTPSCSVRLGRDGTIACRCHGCGWSGDALTLVAVALGLDMDRDFRDVLEEAAAIAGVRLEPRADGQRVEGRARPAPRRPAPEPEPEPEPMPDATFASIVAPLLYAGRLDGSPLVADVERYLEARGLIEEARADGWTGLPEPGALVAWVDMLRAVAEPAEGYAPPFTQADLEGSGLLAPGGRTLSHPAARVVIPWRTAAGTVATIQRRRLDAGVPKYVFPSGRAPSAPYGVDRLAELGPDAPVAFVEGAVDVLALRILYRRNGVARVVLGIPGLGGWRPAWAELARGRDAIVAFDGDKAGEDAVEGVARDLFDAGALRVRRAAPVGAKDWAEALAS